MNYDQIVSKVNETLSTEFELETDILKPEATIFDDLGLDSLDAVDMLVHMEDQIGIKMDIEQFKEVRTLGDIYKLVAKIKEAN